MAFVFNPFTGNFDIANPGGGSGGGDTSALEGRVAALESEQATLKAQMAKVLQAGDKIVGAMTTPDSGPEDAAFSGNIEIQL